MRIANLDVQPAAPVHQLSPERAPLRRALLWACVASLAVAAPASENAAPASLLAQPARSWAAACARNEALVIQHPGPYLRYREKEVDEKGERVRDEIETPEGKVARLVELGGHALTKEEDSAERDRLNALLASPDTFARHIRRDEESKKMGLDLLKLMPDALLWSYAPGQPQLPNRPAGSPALVVLDFKPDPKWSPPNFEADALTGVEGRVWIDPSSRELVRLEATISRAVNIGWGMVARIYPGGTITVQQTEVAGQRWIAERMVEQFTVRAFMVKNVKQNQTTEESGFQKVAPMKYQEAIKMLLDTPLPH